MKRPNGLVISIDGTAGTGKSTVGKAVALELGYSFLSTGAMYRALAYKVFELKVDPTDAKAVLNVAKKLDFTFKRMPDSSLKMRVDGVLLGERLQLDEVGQVASKVSTNQAARDVLTEKMREVGRKGGIIMEGRDIGTVVFPDAEVKFYLDASAEERAGRRVRQLMELGHRPDYGQILASIQQRDERDMHRSAAPLKPAPDAHVIDTSNLTMQQVVAQLLKEINRYAA